MASASEIDFAPRGLMRRGLHVQSRVIGALILRELHTRYGRQNIGYLWLIIEPMLLATAVGLIHTRTSSHFGSDIKPVPLALVGYCNFMTFRTLVSRAEGSLENAVSLFYHRTITPLDVLVSRALLESAGTFLSFTILMALAVAFGVANPPERLLYLMAGIALIIWISFNVSMIVAAITHERRSIGRLIHPMTYIMMPLSGAFFILAYLPGPVRNILLWTPLPHIFEMLRYGWFRSATDQYIDYRYLAGWMIGTFILGLLLLSSMRQRIHMD